MESKSTYNEMKDMREERQSINDLNEYCYEVSSEEEIPFYIAGIFNIRENEYEKGLDFMMEDRDFAILYHVFLTLLQYVQSHGIPSFTFLLEENYVDRVYRDSYYFFFSGKHFSYNRFCKRVFLFARTLDESLLDFTAEELQKHFVGSIVIRPISGRAVGRTLLDPKYFLGDSPVYARWATYSVIVSGKKISVHAFPYSMQDGETTACAEITILNLLDYFSRSYPEYHYLLPSDINRIAQENGYERSLPTHGLKYEVVSKAFCESGFYPRLYSLGEMPTDKLRRILYYYIESGIPLALGVAMESNNKHSVIVIGHGKVNADSQNFNQCYACYDKKSQNTLWVYDASDIIDELCIMDDSQIPYKLMECKINDSNRLLLGDYVIETVVVPLYKKMYLEASDASEIFKVILASQEFGFPKSELNCTEAGDGNASVREEECLGTKEKPLVVRIFMTSSRGLRKCRDEQFSDGNEEVRSWYRTTVFPKFIWVCELSVADKYKKEVIGEIILDATSSADAYADSLIIAHYPRRIFCNLPQDIQELGDKDDGNMHEISKWQPFRPYDSNLYLVSDGE